VNSDWGRKFDDEALVQLLGPVGKHFAGVMDRVPRASRAESIRALTTKKAYPRWLALDGDESVRKAAARDREHFLWCVQEFGLSEARVQAALASWVRAG